MVKENDNSSASHQNVKARLLGLGLDNTDGHVRVTRGDNFHLVGGSRETHEQMQEQAIKFNEKLSDRGKRLEDVSHKEFIDIAQDVGMKIFPDQK